VLLPALICAVAGVVIGGGGSRNWHSDFESAMQVAQRDEKPVLVHFYADWCVPCKRMEREVLHTPEVVGVVSSRVVGVQLNSDHHRDLAARFGVDSIPADVFLDPEGRVLGVMNGFRDKRDYVRRVSAIDEHYSNTQRAVVGRRSDSSSAERDSKGPRLNPEAKATRRLLGLKGYCPVTLYNQRQWVRGEQQFAVRHQGITYFCASRETAARFQSEPIRYAPRLLGCDPVVYFTTGKAVPGSIEHAAFYKDVLHLFANEKTRAEFRENPTDYTSRRSIVLLDELDLAMLEQGGTR